MVQYLIAIKQLPRWLPKPNQFLHTFSNPRRVLIAAKVGVNSITKHNGVLNALLAIAEQDGHGPASYDR